MAKTNLEVVIGLRAQPFAAADRETYQVDILVSPFHAWGGPLLPLSMDESQIGAVWRQFQRDVERHQQRGDRAYGELELYPLRVTGEMLYGTLPENVQRHLREVERHARSQNAGLRLILEFDRSAAALATLPWELLHDPDGQFFYALRGGGLSRRYSVETGSRVSPNYAPGAVLGVWAEPEDGASLAARRETGPAPDGSGVLFSWISGPDTLEQLERALGEGRFDGVHIVAHGSSLSGEREPAVAFADAENRQHWVSLDQLAVLFSGTPQVRFLYLDICAAGSGSHRSGAVPAGGPPGGIARRLIGSGPPVTIVMQTEIGQKAAGWMAEAFYQAVQRGEHVCDAITLARRAVRLRLDDPVHWAVPVVYMQSHPPEPTSPDLRAVDWLLNNVHRLLAARGWILLAGLLMAGYVAGRLAPIDHWTGQNWLAFAFPVMLSNLIVYLGAASMRAGYQHLEETHSLRRRDWWAVLLEKYTQAGVFASVWWLLIWLFWLTLAWVGWQPEAATRRGLWTAMILGLALAGFTGARNAIRQNQLFFRVNRSIRYGQAVFLFLALPLVPLFIVWLMITIWWFLVGSGLGLTVLIGAILGLAGAIQKMLRGRG